MPMSDPHEPISIIEDLDPDPPPTPGSAQRLELFLGALLLIAVLAFVGYQWWHQQYQSTSYAQGQQAAARDDWDVAQSYFSQAGDYRDAPTQANHAQQQIDQRNRLYTSAQAHASHSEWLAALTDIRAAEKIEPNYPGLNQ